MPNSSLKSRTKSIRFPNDLWFDIEMHCIEKDITFNEWVVGVLRQATPKQPPKVAKGQRRLPV